MIVTVLKPFPYAADQIHGEVLPVGKVLDIPADLVPGLEESGLIRVGGEVVTEVTVKEVVVTESKKKK